MATRNISPHASKLAQDKGVDLDDLEGTGKNGQVTKQDVEGYLADQKASTEFEDIKDPPRQEEVVIKKPPDKEVSQDSFYTSKPIKENNNRMHLVRYNGRVTYWTKPQILQTTRRDTTLIVTDGSGPGDGLIQYQGHKIKANVLELPRDTAISIPKTSRCKGCGK